MSEADPSEIPGDIEETYGYAFRNPQLAIEAMTDPSCYHPAAPRPSTPHNRRLELLGDSVLRTIVLEHLLSTHAFLDVNAMQDRVGWWASNEVLARIAAAIGLDGFVLALAISSPSDRPRPPRRHGERHLACGLEALVGAIQVDRGYEAAKTFVLEWILPHMLDTPVPEESPKDLLRRMLLKQRGCNPAYVIVSEGQGLSGYEYVVRVMGEDVTLGTGTASSKRDADFAAARDALSRLI